jgi:hypothetical protein
MENAEGWGIVINELPQASDPPPEGDPFCLKALRSSMPARVRSGVVLVTTGGLSVARLFLGVRLLIEEGDVVLAQQIEKLAPCQAQELSPFPSSQFTQGIEPHNKRFEGEGLQLLSCEKVLCSSP